MKTTTPLVSDDDLMVFADGQADADLASKVTIAMQSDPALADRVRALKAQVAEVQDALDVAVLGAPQMPGHLALDGQPHRQVVLPLALAASFVLGMITLFLAQPAPTWIDRVASYQALYVTDTLAGDVQNPTLTQTVLSQTKTNVGVDLRAVPELAGMTFKRVQMLAIDDAPLVQFAYLAEDGTPFALCILYVGEADQSVENTTSHDLSVATWIDNGVGYMLIGGSDGARVSALATGLAERV